MNKVQHLVKQKLIVPLMLCLCLTGCSTFGFFFDQLPFITTWQMDRMFDLNDEQEEMVEQGAEEMQQWFVDEGFPKIILRLETAHRLWSNGQHTEAARYFEQGADDSIKEFMQAVSPKLIPLMLTFNQDNAAQYRAYNEDKTDEWFEYAESQRAKVESREKRLKNWYGKLTDDQKNKVESIALLLPNERETRLANNDNWVEKFLQTALEKNEEELTRWLADPSVWWLPEYAALKAQNRQQTRELVAMMIETMSERQQARVAEHVEDWIDNLKDVL